MDSAIAARHRAFIATRLLGGLLALAVMPVHFALRGAPSPLEAAIFVWFVSPLLVAWYLSRTGAFERAHILSALSMSGLIALVAGATGGLGSFAIAWVAVLPFEAALSSSRRAILCAAGMSLAVVLGLWALGSAGLLPETPAASSATAMLLMLGTITATLYATVTAMRAGSLALSGEEMKQLGETRYRLIAEHAADMITRHGRSGSTLFISPAGEKLAGVHASQLTGHGLFDRVHVADRPAFLHALADAACGQEATIEYRLRRGSLAPENSGEPMFVWVEMRCVPASAEDIANGQHPEVIAVSRDITSRKRDAAALEAAREETARANAAKSRFLATVSHELRTPLNAIIGFSDMLKKEQEIGLDLERRMDYARLINDSGLHLLAVVNGILDVSRIEAGHFEVKTESFAIAPLAEACYEMMLLRAEQAGLDLELNVAPDLPEVRADKVALRQILINLLSNAIKFTPRGGSVDLNVDVDDGDLILVVQDSGIGIAESDLVQLGNPFFQVKGAYDRPYEGTGLGLSVVKGLVGLHGGRIDIKSRLGQGTNVVVRLPREGQGEAARETPKLSSVIELPKARAVPAETRVKKSA